MEGEYSEHFPSLFRDFEQSQAIIYLALYPSPRYLLLGPWTELEFRILEFPVF